MAITFKLDEAQSEKLITAINNLTTEVSKWQAAQAEAVEDGFTTLAAILSGGDDAKVQELIQRVRAVRESVKKSIDQHQGE